MKDPNSKASLKRIWRGMLARCDDLSDPRYGGRGIAVCARWRESFDTFVSDMGPRPSAEHSIDRKNNDGHYAPQNCRWATKQQQARNTRTTLKLEFRGKVKALGDWTDETGVVKHTAYYRLLRGWPVRRALTDKNFGRRSRVAQRLAALRMLNRTRAA